MVELELSHETFCSSAEPRILQLELFQRCRGLLPELVGCFLSVSDGAGLGMGSLNFQKYITRFLILMLYFWNYALSAINLKNGVTFHSHR